MKAVCIATGPWANQDGGRLDGPKTGDILNVTDIELWEGDLYLSFAEYGHKNMFHCIHFRPVDDTFADQVLEAIAEEAEVELEPALVE